MPNEHGKPCDDCKAHSGIVTSAKNAEQQIFCLSQKVEQIESERESAHKNIHRRIDEMEKSKTSNKTFIWIVGLILGAIVLVSGFLWESTKEAAASNKDFHEKVGDKMLEMAIDIQVIKTELEKN